MRRLAIGASLTLSLAVPAVAYAKPVTPRHAGVYRYLRRLVIKQDGVRAAGRYILRDGLSNGHAATDADAVASIGVFERDLYPSAPVFTPVQTPAATATSYSAPAVSTPTTSYSSSSGGCGGVTPYAGGGQCWAIPYSVVQCESGGQNVPNSQGSGANGYYQLMSGGGGSRAEQDAAASRLWAGGAGASNWTCAGGQ